MNIQVGYFSVRILVWLVYLYFGLMLPNSKGLVLISKALVLIGGVLRVWVCRDCSEAEIVTVLKLFDGESMVVLMARHFLHGSR